MNPIRQVLRRGLAAAAPRRLFLTQALPEDRRVYFTFDDGPHPVHTPAVLDVLARLNARATFFVVGAAAARHPDLVQRIADEGHTLGHHSYDHGAHEEVSAARLLSEANRTARLLASVIGGRPRLFRPPFGKLTVAKTVGLWGAGYTLVLWNQDPKDFAAADPAQVSEWFASHPLSAGDIVLMHDTHATAAAVLPDAILRARTLGLEPRGLWDVLPR